MTDPPDVFDDDPYLASLVVAATRCFGHWLGGAPCEGCGIARGCRIATTSKVELVVVETVGLRLRPAPFVAPCSGCQDPIQKGALFHHDVGRGAFHDLCRW